MDLRIHGERVILRPWRLEDVAGLMELWSDGLVMRYVGFPGGLTVTREGVEDRILTAASSNGITEGSFRLAVTSRETGEFMGETAIGHIDAEGTSHPDIKLLPAYWGKGYGEEVLKLVTAFTFAFTPAARILVEPHVDNIGARKVYSRAGFHQSGGVKRYEGGALTEPKGTSPVVYHDFILTREDYLAAKTRREPRARDPGKQPPG